MSLPAERCAEVGRRVGRRVISGIAAACCLRPLLSSCSTLGLALCSQACSRAAPVPHSRQRRHAGLTVQLLQPCRPRTGRSPPRPPPHAAIGRPRLLCRHTCSPAAAAAAASGAAAACAAGQPVRQARVPAGPAARRGVAHGSPPCRRTAPHRRGRGQGQTRRAAGRLHHLHRRVPASLRTSAALGSHRSAPPTHGLLPCRHAGVKFADVQKGTGEVAKCVRAAGGRDGVPRGKGSAARSSTHRQRLLWLQLSQTGAAPVAGKRSTAVPCGAAPGDASGKRKIGGVHLFVLWAQERGPGAGQPGGLLGERAGAPGALGLRLGYCAASRRAPLRRQHGEARLRG